MSKEAEQLSFEENWFEQHDIMGKLEDVQYDELLLQFLNDNKQYLAAWLIANPQARVAGLSLDDMPQKLYRELITWFRESQVRIDHWNKWLEARIPEMPEPEYGEDCDKN